MIKCILSVPIRVDPRLKGNAPVQIHSKIGPKFRPFWGIFDLVEETCNGAETCIIENDKTMRAYGFGFSGGAGGVGLNTIGAIARHIGPYDVREFFGPKARVKGIHG